VERSEWDEMKWMARARIHVLGVVEHWLQGTEGEKDEEIFFEQEKGSRKVPADLFSFENLTSGQAASKKVELMEQRRKREELLEGTSKGDISTQNFKEKFEVPAYERKNVTFQQVPHSSERNISKFNLTEDNQILGNNKFLHDNVD
jgi:cell division protein FtsZ